MTAPAITIAQLNELDPCSDGSRRVRAALRKLDADKGRAYTAADARAAGCTFDDIAWAATAVGLTDRDVERRIRLFLADCAVRVLPIYANYKPGDDRPRAAIQAVRVWAQAPSEAARAAMAARAAGAAEADRAAGAARAAEAAWAAGAAGAAERDWQFDKLIEWLSDTPPEPLPLPATIREQAA